MNDNPSLPITYTDGPLSPAALRLFRAYLRTVAEAEATRKRGYDRVAGLDRTLTTSDLTKLNGLLTILDHAGKTVRQAAYKQALEGWAPMHTPPSNN